MFYDPRTAMHQEDDGELQDIPSAPKTVKKQSPLVKLAMTLWRKIRG